MSLNIPVLVNVPNLFITGAAGKLQHFWNNFELLKFWVTLTQIKNFEVDSNFDLHERNAVMEYIYIVIDILLNFTEGLDID